MCTESTYLETLRAISDALRDMLRDLQSEIAVDICTAGAEIRNDNLETSAATLRAIARKHRIHGLSEYLYTAQKSQRNPQVLAYIINEIAEKS